MWSFVLIVSPFKQDSKLLEFSPIYCLQLHQEGAHRHSLCLQCQSFKCKHATTQINRKLADPRHVNTLPFSKALSGIPLKYSLYTLNHSVICLLADFIQVTNPLILSGSEANCVFPSLHSSIKSCTVSIWLYLRPYLCPGAISLGFREN